MRAVIVCPSGATIRVDVACTERERVRGLSGYAGLIPGTGMLLAFEQPARPRITMATMSFPLDLVWLDWDKRIVELAMDAPAGSPGYRSSQLACYVLEIPAGDIQRLGLRLGDVLRF